MPSVLKLNVLMKSSQTNDLSSLMPTVSRSHMLSVFCLDHIHCLKRTQSSERE